MRSWLLYGCFLLLSCGPEPERVTVTTQTSNTASAPAHTEIATDINSNVSPDTSIATVAPIPRIKKPTGIYRFLLPYEGGDKILHTVAFYPDSYRLQEEYPGKKDSIVVTEGTWAPSEGYIWLYKDQIVRGRYTWKGDTLQYYSPQMKKAFSMEKLSPAVANAVWQTKKKAGTQLYGVGNEPFWSVELTGNDSLVLNMPDWTAPLSLKLAATTPAKDSTVYTAGNDSLSVTVYPFFCNDGMSDFLYTRRVKVVYHGQTYRGCGEVLRPSY
jgi:uncharacterized membrane protein